MTVSFETAKELKEAGFPQPSDIMHPYGKNKWLMFYVEPSEEGDAPELYSLDRIDDIRTFSDPCEIFAYAPTATDLIPPGWGILRNRDNWSCGDDKVVFSNDNPSEAAAMAWLFVNRKKDQK